MKRHYITAVRELLAAGQEPGHVISGLKKVLEDRGHTALLPAILRGVAREMEDGAKDTKPRVTVAKKGDEKSEREAIEKALASLKATDEFAIHYDENIIGGAIVEANHERVDMSYRRALINLYHSITK